jgi:hypothetical protein
MNAPLAKTGGALFFLRHYVVSAACRASRFRTALFVANIRGFFGFDSGIRSVRYQHVTGL